MEKRPKDHVNIDKGEPIHKKKVDDLIKEELIDSTMYGEIIPSVMGWESFEEQERRSNRLLEISDELTAKAKKSKDD